MQHCHELRPSPLASIESFMSASSPQPAEDLAEHRQFPARLALRRCGARVRAQDRLELVDFQVPVCADVQDLINQSLG